MQQRPYELFSPNLPPRLTAVVFYATNASLQVRLLLGNAGRSGGREAVALPCLRTGPGGLGPRTWAHFFDGGLAPFNMHYHAPTLVNNLVNTPSLSLLLCPLAGLSTDTCLGHSEPASTAPFSPLSRQSA